MHKVALLYRNWLIWLHARMPLNDVSWLIDLDALYLGQLEIEVEEES